MVDVLTAVIDAHRTLLAPDAIDAKRHKASLICFATTFAICGLFDAIVARRFKKPYFVLHVFVNAVITALVVPGAIKACTTPYEASVPAPGVQQPDALYMVWIFALHIYHPIFFRTGVMDWVHHVPVYILNSLCFTIPSCNATHLQSLIMMGVPGGLDYLLQVLEGEGKLTRAYYKELCSLINVYVRAPLGAWGSYVMLVGLYHGWEHATTYQAGTLLLLALHAYWNPPFFGRQAVEANIVDTINRYGLAGGALKLPKVRALCSHQPKAGAAKAPAPPPAKRVEAYPVGAGTDAALPAISPVSVIGSDELKKKL